MSTASALIFGFTSSPASG